MLVTLLLVAWEPLTFALYAASVVDRIVDRGPLAVAVLLARVIVTAIGIAAGLAIWNDRPWAIRFARLAFALSAAASILGAVTHALPSSIAPGLAGPALVATLAWDAGWIGYLTLVTRNAERGTRD